jgi:hypothetical protein
MDSLVSQVCLVIEQADHVDITAAGQANDRGILLACAPDPFNSRSIEFVERFGALHMEGRISLSVSATVFLGK